jgi:hypothetical protein
VSVVRERVEVGRMHVSLYGGQRRYSIFEAGKWQVNDVYAEVPLWCASGPIARRVFGSFLTARIGVSVGRLPQEVLLEEFYRSECSETVRVRRVCMFEEFPTVFNRSELTFGVQ